MLTFTTARCPFLVEKGGLLTAARSEFTNDRQMMAQGVTFSVKLARAVPSQLIAPEAEGIRVARPGKIEVEADVKP